MNGVEILATQEVATTFGMDWNNLFLVMAIISAFGVLFFLVFLVGMLNWWKRALLGLSVALVLSFLIGAPAFSNSKPLEYETQYKVTISDEVQMNDFLERYEIISQEGKIYTVRERQ